MKDETTRNIRVGIIVIIGTALIITALYLIGNKQNLFGSTFHISADFYNVNGLMPGNNVRLSGINVGTVESVDIASDSSVKVVMLIEDRVKQYIRKNAIVSIGTDGLMGNKLVNINSGEGEAKHIEEGDVLTTLKPFETDEILRTLNTTNDNIKDITTDLKAMTSKLNSQNTLWRILMDTVIAENVKNAIVSIKLMSNRTAVITGDLSKIVNDVKAGKGTIGTLLTDTTFSGKLSETLVNIEQITDKMAVVSGDLSTVSEKLKSGEGSIGALLMDTTFVGNLNKSMENIKDGSQGFNENMEALKHNILLRKYFKEKDKKQK